MNIAQYILSLIRLDRTIRYHGDYERLVDLMQTISNGKLNKLGIRCTKISETKYTLEPEANTPMEMSGPYFSFSQDSTVHIILKKKSEKLQLIHCQGKIKTIHYGLIGFYIFFLATQVLFTSHKISTTAIIVWTILWIISHLLLNFYWSQKEKDVIEQFKKAMLILMKLDNRK